MSKPVWKCTHTGEGGEQLFLCEGKLYSKFAWDNFLDAYKGKATPVNNWRGGSGTSVYGKPDTSGQYEIDFGNLFDDDDTLPGTGQIRSPNGPNDPGGWILHVPAVNRDGDD